MTAELPGWVYRLPVPGSTAQLPRQPLTVVDTVQLSRPVIEKAQVAAKYIGNEKLATTISMVLKEQSTTSTEISIPKKLKVQIQTAFRLARDKQQKQFATDILQSAAQLLVQAHQLELTVSTVTPQGKITKLEGKKYSVRSRVSPDGKQELKVICHQTKGIAFSVNGHLKKNENLKSQDTQVLKRYAEMTSGAMREALAKKTEAERG